MVKMIKNPRQRLREWAVIGDPDWQECRPAVLLLRRIVGQLNLIGNHFAVYRGRGKQDDDGVGVANSILNLLCPFDANGEVAINEYLMSMVFKFSFECL